jgi:hypothetical protein
MPSPRSAAPMRPRRCANAMGSGIPPNDYFGSRLPSRLRVGRLHPQGSRTKQGTAPSTLGVYSKCSAGPIASAAAHPATV